MMKNISYTFVIFLWGFTISAGLCNLHTLLFHSDGFFSVFLSFFTILGTLATFIFFVSNLFFHAFSSKTKVENGK